VNGLQQETLDRLMQAWSPKDQRACVGEDAITVTLPSGLRFLVDPDGTDAMLTGDYSRDWSGS